MTLQQRLKSLRLGRLLTQKELAGLLNVSQNAIYNWENGNREPNKEMIEKIASLFGVSPAYLMGWENERTVFIADNLKKIMELKNISSSELANLSDLPVGYVSLVQQTIPRRRNAHGVFFTLFLLQAG